MFCPECGSKNDDNSAFCGNCGTKLVTEGVQESSVLKEGKRKFSLPVSKALFIESAIVILSIAIFTGVYQVQCSAKSTAKKYAKAVIEKDWNTIYDLISMKKSGDFMTKEAFVTAYTIESGTETSTDVDILSVDKRSGGLLNAKYCVEYDVGDYADEMDIRLKRQGLLWKVVTQSYPADKYTFHVPAGAEVSVDKIKVPENMKAAATETGYDTYEIPKIFGDTHYVEVKGEKIKTKGSLLTNYADEGSDYLLNAIEADYTSESVKDVMEQAGKDMKEILYAASAGKRFSEIDVFKNISKPQKENLINSYNSLRDGDFGNGYGSSIIKYQITNGELEGKIVGQDDGDTNLVEVCLGGRQYWEDSEGYSGDEICEHSLSYVYEDDSWKLYDMHFEVFRY